MKKYLLTFLFFLFLFVLFGCHTSSTDQKKKHLVLVSLPPYGYVVEKIAGPTVTVKNLLPLGANLHDFEPTAKDLTSLLQADLWFSNGDLFEEKICEAMSHTKNSFVKIDLSQNLELLAVPGQHHSKNEQKDKHLWLSPKMLQKQTLAITSALEKIYPEHKDFYQKNCKSLLDELAHLDEEISSLLAPYKGKAILVSHPAYTYFCHDYSLEQISIEYEGKELSAKKLGEIWNLSREKNIKLVLLQNYHNNKGAAFIAQKLDLSTYMLDPFSSDYITFMQNLSQLISQTYQE
jgi:zinc transport system substrate-binding protein